MQTSFHAMNDIMRLACCTNANSSWYSIWKYLYSNTSEGTYFKKNPLMETSIQWTGRYFLEAKPKFYVQNALPTSLGCFLWYILPVIWNRLRRCIQSAMRIFLANVEQTRTVAKNKQESRKISEFPNFLEWKSNRQQWLVWRKSNSHHPTAV